jgi:hypothetical protein
MKYSGSDSWVSLDGGMGKHRTDRFTSLADSLALLLALVSTITLNANSKAVLMRMSFATHYLLLKLVVDW